MFSSGIDRSASRYDDRLHEPVRPAPGVPSTDELAIDHSSRVDKDGSRRTLCRKVLWFHPINMNRVDRSEPSKSLNERRFRQRTLEVLVAITLGWLPGLLIQRLFGSVDTRLILTILAVSVAAAVIYVFRAMRRFDHEGRERHLRRVIAEESERGDSAD